MLTTYTPDDDVQGYAGDAAKDWRAYTYARLHAGADAQGHGQPHATHDWRCCSAGYRPDD